MNRKERRALGIYKPKDMPADVERHIVKIEIPRVLSVDGLRVGKVKIASKDESFVEYVDNSFELEKMCGPDGFGFFELLMKDGKIGGLQRIRPDKPW